MSTLPEQFSQARASQLEAQLAMVRSFTGKAIESVEKIVALNLSTSRAALEKSSAAVNQIFSAKDPRDLLALTTQGQAGFDGLLAYGRQLLNIAAELQPSLAKSAAAPATPTPLLAAPAVAAAPVAEPAAPPAAAEQPAAFTAPAEQVAQPAPQAAAAEPEVKLAKPKKPAVEVAPEPVVEAIPEPVAKAKPIAKAAAKVADAPVELPKPAATFPAPTSRLVSVPPVKPVEASPPPAPVSGTPLVDAKHDAKQGDLLAAKAPKKK